MAPISPETCGLFFQAECLRHSPVAGVYENGKEKPKCLHTYDLQSVAHRSQEAVIFSCGKKNKTQNREKVFHREDLEPEPIQIQGDRKVSKWILQRDSQGS